MIKKRGDEYTPIECYKDAFRQSESGRQVDFLGMVDDPACTAEEMLTFSMSKKFIKGKGTGRYERLNQYCRDHKEGICYLAGKDASHIPFREFRTEMRDYLFVSHIPLIWAKYRQIYRPDSEFADTLVQTEGIRIPMDVFQHAPYPCFYVDFSNIERFRPFVGSYVFLSQSDETGLMDITFLRVAKLNNVATDSPYFTSPYMFYSAYFSTEEMIRHRAIVGNEHGGMDMELERWQIAGDSSAKANLWTAQITGQESVPDQHRGDMILLLFNVLLYLCSESPDIVTNKRGKLRRDKREERNGGGEKECTPAGIDPGSEDKNDILLNDIGLRYGTAIRTQRKQQERGDREQREENGHGNVRKRPTAHTRRAHWHTYRVGAGRKETRLRWLAPIFVNGSTQSTAVMHEIKP